MSQSAVPLMPALFWCHGGGPMPLLPNGGGCPDMLTLADTWRAAASATSAAAGTPTAIVVVSAHYESSDDCVRIGGAAAPVLEFDYGGFPPAAYALRYAAPGAPALAAEMRLLLAGRGIRVAVEAGRALDHGVFVPLIAAFPGADVPVVPLSVLRSQVPSVHAAVGAALAPLRARGVLFVGSGSSSHNLAFFGRSGRGTTGATDGSVNVAGAAFNAELARVLSDDAAPVPAQLAALDAFLDWPLAAEAQRRGAAEHLMPLFTVLGTSRRFAGHFDALARERETKGGGDRSSDGTARAPPLRAELSIFPVMGAAQLQAVFHD